MSETAYQPRVDIPGLLIPLGGMNLILPNAAVVEVLAAREIHPVEGTPPEWLLGTFSWRNKVLPLISFQQMLNQEAMISDERRRIAVVHSFSSGSEAPFVGVEVQGLPRLVKLNEEALEILPADEGQDEWPVEEKIQVNEDVAYIPDIKTIGKMLDKLSY